MFKLLIENKLILSNRFGFKPDDYCINQLFFITHEKHESFDARLEVGSVSHGISKIFDNV